MLHAILFNRVPNVSKCKNGVGFLITMKCNLILKDSHILIKRNY